MKRVTFSTSIYVVKTPVFNIMSSKPSLTKGYT